MEVPRLLIQIKKKSDGSAALSCRRADGTVTWQRQEGLQGQFFPRHDLTHYAVEAVLHRDHSFFGLVASGWELADFQKPYPKGPLLPEALASEVLVGFLDQERGAAVHWEAADFNDSARSYFASTALPEGAMITGDQLAEIRALRAALFDRWDALGVGETLELTFPHNPAA